MKDYLNTSYIQTEKNCFHNPIKMTFSSFKLMLRIQKPTKRDSSIVIFLELYILVEHEHPTVTRIAIIHFEKGRKIESHMAEAEHYVMCATSVPTSVGAHQSHHAISVAEKRETKFASSRFEGCARTAISNSQ